MGNFSISGVCRISSPFKLEVSAYHRRGQQGKWLILTLLLSGGRRKWLPWEVKTNFHLGTGRLEWRLHFCTSRRGNVTMFCSTECQWKWCLYFIQDFSMSVRKWSWFFNVLFLCWPCLVPELRETGEKCIGRIKERWIKGWMKHGNRLFTWARGILWPLTPSHDSCLAKA